MTYMVRELWIPGNFGNKVMGVRSIFWPLEFFNVVAQDINRDVRGPHMLDKQL